MVKKRRKKSLGSPPIIGLVGGIASGKSFVAEILEQLGCERIDADRIGHQVLDNPMIQYSLRQSFGSEIFSDSGSVNRGQLGRMVFGSQSEAVERRARLEEIIHPAIRAAAIQQIRRLREQSRPPIAIVVDAPLLIEAGWENMCDWIFFIDTSNETRRQRALQRGWSEDHWRDRERTQLGLDQKKQSATHFIPGDTEPEALSRHLSRILEQVNS